MPSNVNPASVGSAIRVFTGLHDSNVGVSRSRMKSRNSSLVAVTHIAGPGSSAMAQQAQFITVWVLALCAAHCTAMSRIPLLAKSSITARTQGEASDRHRPGIGEVSSTLTCSSHHCQGGRRSAGLQAPQNPATNG
jgi:hypothetical protein